jgi:aryl-alcohol dehydrogenase-like predicted oxidoreductase
MLGRTGFEVSEIGFGAWGIGSKHYGEIAEAKARETLEVYLAGGGNFIDTARGYSVSEEVIGRFLKDSDARDQVVLATKVWPTDTGAIWSDLHTSLELLQTDAIDIYFMHDPPDEPDEMNRVLDVFEEARSQGKIRKIGASIKGGNVTGATQDLCRQYIESGRCDVILLIFSMLRQTNRAVFREATEAGVGIIARTVLESGFITGAYKPGHRFPGTFPQGDHRSRWNGERLDRILEQADKVAEMTVKPPYENLAQVAIRFALDEPDLPAIILGMMSAQEARENVAIADLPPLPSGVRQKLVEMFADGEALVNL